MPKGVKAGVFSRKFGVPVLIHLASFDGDASRYLCGLIPSVNYVAMIFNSSRSRREYKPERSFWAFVFPCFQSVDQRAG